MLHKFLSANRTDLIARCRVKVAQRTPSGVDTDELTYGISLFLDQLIMTFVLEETARPSRIDRTSSPSVADNAASNAMSQTATLHGRELIAHGFTIEQVVHDYGDLCQSITELAFEK